MDCCQTNQVNLSFGVTAWFICEIRVDSWLTEFFKLRLEFSQTHYLKNGENVGEGPEGGHDHQTEDSIFAMKK
jgi:hypothetical protein